MLVPPMLWRKNLQKEINKTLMTLEKILKAFDMPQKLVKTEIESIQQIFADRLFWFALSDIHTITSGKLKDWKENDEDLLEGEIEG